MSTDDRQPKSPRVRSIAEYGFEDGGYLSIKVHGPTPIIEVLDMAAALLEMKRQEVMRNEVRGAS